MGILRWLFGGGSSRRAQAYQRGIARRYYANREGWDAHREQTKGAILDFVRDEGLRELAVLGSGWLLDVPVEELLEGGVSLRLYDYAHPPQVMERFAGREGVDFVTLDITGGIMEVFGRADIPASGLVEFAAGLRPPDLDIPEGCGVVSVNLLSQLPYPLVERFGDGLAPGVIPEAGALLQRAHLDMLGRCGAALVVTDVEEQHYELGTGRLVRRVPTVYMDLAVDGEWVWGFDGDGSYARGHRVDLRVAWWRMGGWG